MLLCRQLVLFSNPEVFVQSSMPAMSCANAQSKPMKTQLQHRMAILRIFSPGVAWSRLFGRDIFNNAVPGKRPRTWSGGAKPGTHSPRPVVMGPGLRPRRFAPAPGSSSGVGRDDAN